MKKCFEDNDYLMSPKAHYLFDYFERFEKNCGGLSDEQGELFHQTLLRFEEDFRGKPLENMISEYFWWIYDNN